jgi:CheY-like chemotaxis protein
MNQNPRRILIVDDHLPSRRLASLILAGAGWLTDEATRGTEALAKLANGSYRCVLLDVSMPDMSGEAVCRAIRDNPATAGLRVVAYTAHAMTHERQKILAIGFDDIVIKPATMARLVDAVAGETAQAGA